MLPRELGFLPCAPSRVFVVGRRREREEAERSLPWRPARRRWPTIVFSSFFFFNSFLLIFFVLSKVPSLAYFLHISFSGYWFGGEHHLFSPLNAIEAKWMALLFCSLVELVQKKSIDSINSRLALVMKSGKYTLGYKTVLKTLRNSKGIHSSIFTFLCLFLLLLLFLCTHQNWYKFVEN